MILYHPLNKDITLIENKKRKIELHKYENLVENILFIEDTSPKNQFDHEIYDGALEKHLLADLEDPE